MQIYVFKVVVVVSFVFLMVPTEGIAQTTDNTCVRSVSEYLLPKSKGTHEILFLPAFNLLLVTQYSASRLLKATTSTGAIGTEAGQVLHVRGYTIGDSNSGLHGLTSSNFYPGKIWVSLENGNQLILMEPFASSLTTAPTTVKTILIPSPGVGPHNIVEYETNMWATLKASEHVIRINHQNFSDYKLYKAQPTPAFLGIHPVSKDVYVSEYKSNSILRLNLKTNTETRIQVPPNIGSSPVGIVPNGNFAWVALLSIKSKAKGGFGKIYSNGTIEWLKLKSPIGKTAALLHLGFDLEEKTEPKPGMWLLASSTEESDAFDMIIRTNFDNRDFETFQNEEIAFLTSQNIKAHRLLVTKNGVYVSELTSSRVALYKRSNSSNCNFMFQPVHVGNTEEI